jgi:hypothetical protein
MSKHEYDAFASGARALRQPLSSHILELARKGRDDQLPYYAQIGAIHSVIATSLMLLQLHDQVGSDPERYNEICKKVDNMVISLVAPMPNLPAPINDALRWQRTGFVRDMAEALAKHLKA